MNFALSNSREAVRLADRGAWPVDLLKCPLREEPVAEAGRDAPVYVHFSLHAGRGIGPARIDWAAQTLQRTSTPHVNAHLSPPAGDSAGGSMTPDGHAGMLEAAIADVDLLVERSGCGLVPDLAHARLAAELLEMDVRDYVAGLPTGRLRELHVSGVAGKDGEPPRDHHRMREKDWSVAEWALARVRRGDWPEPWVLTLEYGGAGPPFERRCRPDVLAPRHETG